MTELDIDDIQRRMDASLASLHTEFMGLRAGRASTGMLEPIMVDAYGISGLRLKTLAAQCTGVFGPPASF